MIRRTCDSMNMPNLPVGHWAKLEFGSLGEKAVLPPTSCMIGRPLPLLPQESEARREQVTSVAARWQDASRIRAFLADLRAQLAGRYACEDAGGLLAEWLGFAEDYSDKIDPIPGILAEIDKARSARHRSGSLGAEPTTEQS
jgi:hypothetical protein